MQLSAVKPKSKRVKTRNSAGLPTRDEYGQALASLRRNRARLQRQFDATLKQLIAVQAARKERERQALSDGESKASTPLAV